VIDHAVAIGRAQALLKSERCAEPVDGFRDVAVDEDRNDVGRGSRTIAHGCPPVPSSIVADDAAGALVKN
jgi:hypothetical protein